MEVLRNGTASRIPGAGSQDLVISILGGLGLVATTYLNGGRPSTALERPTSLCRPFRLL